MRRRFRPHSGATTNAAADPRAFDAAQCPADDVAYRCADVRTDRGAFAPPDSRAEPRTVGHYRADDHPDRCTNVCADMDTTDGRAIPSTDLQADGGTNGATIAKPDGDTDRLADLNTDERAEPGAHGATDVGADAGTDTSADVAANRGDADVLAVAAVRCHERRQSVGHEAELDGRRPVRERVVRG